MVVVTNQLSYLGGPLCISPSSWSKTTHRNKPWPGAHPAFRLLFGVDLSVPWFVELAEEVLPQRPTARGPWPPSGKKTASILWGWYGMIEDSITDHLVLFVNDVDTWSWVFEDSNWEFRGVVWGYCCCKMDFSLLVCSPVRAAHPSQSKDTKG